MASITLALPLGCAKLHAGNPSPSRARGPCVAQWLPIGRDPVAVHRQRLTAVPHGSLVQGQRGQARSALLTVGLLHRPPPGSFSSGHLVSHQLRSSCHLSCSPSARSAPAARRFHCRASAEADKAASGSDSATAGAATAEAGQLSAPATGISTQNGTAGRSAGGADGDDGLPSGELVFEEPSGWRQFSTKVKMFFCVPWQRVKKGSVLAIRLAGAVNELPGGGFSSSGLSLPQICENLRKAAVDPRVSALVLKVEPLACGWGKIEELKRHIDYFKKSGKPCVAYMATGGEKEYYLASACSELYVPPGAYISLRGLAVQGQFLGGVLEKLGVQAQIERIGKYKSAGDQLARSEMSAPNREMLSALLDDIYAHWVAGVASHRGKTKEDVEQLLDQGVLEMEQLRASSWVDGIKYENEVEDLLKEKTGGKMDKPLRTVSYKKYSRVKAGTLGIAGARGDQIAVIRAVGNISRGKGGRTGQGIASDAFIAKIRSVKDEKKYKAVVLRIDSPGGDALASDLMWHELRLLCEKKPVVASMADVAASGGYYMAMGTQCIVAEPLTLTGSIGVVTGKFNLGELYKRVGFNKEILSRGRYSQMDADNRPFTDEEEAYFKQGAELAYKSFRDKAAMSRGLAVEEMEEVAQGRVWTGHAAAQRRLVDTLGGIGKAVAIAKLKAGIPQDKDVRLVELTRQQPSLASLLSAGSQAAAIVFANGGLSGDRSAALNEIVRDLFFPDEWVALSSGDPQALMDDIWVGGVSRLDNGPGASKVESLVLLEAVKSLL